MSLQAIIHHFFITILVVANLYYGEIVYGDNDVFTFKKRKKKEKEKKKNRRQNDNDGNKDGENKDLCYSVILIDIECSLQSSARSFRFRRRRTMTVMNLIGHCIALKPITCSNPRYIYTYITRTRITV